MLHRTLGTSGLRVSVLALGSWRTFERIGRDAGLVVMLAARDAGIDFLDDARYNDETGTAPIPTGYSEVVFGELFRAAAWRRDEVTVANKLWWEFWPAQSARDEIAGSLARMGLDHIDLMYSAPPPRGLPVADLVGEVGELMASGKARAWGVLNWPADLLDAAVQEAVDGGVPAPCAAQLPYNLVHRAAVEDAGVSGALRRAACSVVASATLANGALTGKYAAGARGRLAAQLDEPARKPALEVGEALRGAANRLATTPAALALAFALANDLVASVLFGATAPEQVVENAAAVEVLNRLAPHDLEMLRAIGARARS